VDGIIYAIGGSPWDADWAACSTVEAYDPVANTWTKRTDMIETRGALSIVVLDGEIYAVGGSEDGSSVGLQKVEVYDPVKDTWTEGKADMLIGRHTLSASAVDGKIYAIGGITGGGGQALATVEEFTPEVLLQPGLVSPQSKLPTKWGAEKGRRDSGTRGW